MIMIFGMSMVNYVQPTKFREKQLVPFPRKICLLFVQLRDKDWKYIIYTYVFSHMHNNSDQENSTMVQDSSVMMK